MPAHLLFALNRLIAFYQVGTPRDSDEVIELFRTHTVAELLSDAAIWGVSLADYVQEVAGNADTSI